MHSKIQICIHLHTKTKWNSQVEFFFFRYAPDSNRKLAVFKHFSMSMVKVNYFFQYLDYQRIKKSV